MTDVATASGPRMELTEGYERLRARRHGDRGCGAELLRRQGLAAWVRLALEHEPPASALPKLSGAVVAPAGETDPTLGERGNVAMVQVLADVAIACLREGLS